MVGDELQAPPLIWFTLALPSPSLPRRNSLQSQPSQVPMSSPGPPLNLPDTLFSQHYAYYNAARVQLAPFAISVLLAIENLTFLAQTCI